MNLVVDDIEDGEEADGYYIGDEATLGGGG
jgi:hypothetical protein